VRNANCRAIQAIQRFLSSWSPRSARWRMVASILQQPQSPLEDGVSAGRLKASRLIAERVTGREFFAISRPEFTVGGRTAQGSQTIGRFWHGVGDDVCRRHR